ncbi:MAG: oligosaccharide flippase family protein [Bacteroidota bacterium]
MNRLVRLLPESLRALARGTLAGPVLTLVSGTVAAQALAYLARPLLTRLFTPEAFGLLGFYLAAVAVLSTAATGKYEDAIPLPASERDAAGVWTLALGLSLVVSLASLAVIPLREPVAALLGRPEVAMALWFVPVGVWAAAWGRASEVWLTRTDRFGSVSGARVAQNAVMVPAQIGAGLTGGAATGLVGGHLAGRLVGTAVLTGVALRKVRPALADLRRLARLYRRFPLFSMPSGFLNTLSMQLPAFLLLAFFAPDVLGLYVLAYGTLAVPMQLVGGAVGQVFFVRAAEARREGALGALTQTVFARLSAFGLFPLAAMLLAAPSAFAVVFGDAWREAGVFAQLLAPWLYFSFVSAPLSALFDVLEQQPSELAFNVALVIARAAALVLGGQSGSALVAVGLFGAVSAAGWLVHTVWMLRWGQADVREAVRAVGRHALVAAGPLALVGAAVWGLGSDLAVTGVLIAAAVLWLGLAARFTPLWPSAEASP